MNVGQMIHSHGWAAIVHEIAKCDVVCVNDHLRRTAKQLNWKKALSLGNAADGPPQADVV